MESCALCENETPTRELVRVSGHDLCGWCRTRDLDEPLAAHEIAVEWDTRLQRLVAAVNIAGMPDEFSMKCVPRLLHHRLVELVSPGLKTGEPTFDRRVRVKTSDEPRAKQLLQIEGLKSALVALMSDLRVNELLRNYVKIDGPHLRVAARPLSGLDEERLRGLKLEVAALALHLRYAPT